MLIATWIQSVVATLALIAAGFAAYHTWQQLQLETDRVERVNAAGLSAWWIIRNNVWGVAISNASAAPFRDVEIVCSGNRTAGNIPVTFKVLPPGTYFIQSDSFGKFGTKKGWLHPQSLDLDETVEPVLKSPSHAVESIKYTDFSGVRWVWESDGGTRKLLNLERKS